jgi:hypothetical protein
MAKLGCLLLILSMLGLCAIVVVPVLPFLDDSPQIDQFLQPILCQPGETVRRDQYSTTDNDGTSYSMNVYCLGDDEVERDVTDRWFLIGLVAFLAPFLVGLFALIFGVQRNAVKSAVNTASGSAGWAVPGSGVMSVNTGSTGKNASLTQRLKELQEARDAGLISAVEYDRMRQQILDSMDD